MKALERIREIESVFPVVRGTPVPRRWQGNPGDIVPMSIADDLEFMIRAFRMMREVACIECSVNSQIRYHEYIGAEIDKEFEKLMADNG